MPLQLADEDTSLALALRARKRDIHLCSSKFFEPEAHAARQGESRETCRHQTALLLGGRRTPLLRRAIVDAVPVARGARRTHIFAIEAPHEITQSDEVRPCSCGAHESADR